MLPVGQMPPSPQPCPTFPVTPGRAPCSLSSGCHLIPVVGGGHSVPVPSDSIGTFVLADRAQPREVCFKYFRASWLGSDFNNSAYH